MSPRSGRQNLAQGKRSAAKLRPGLGHPNLFKPALAGDRMAVNSIQFRPLKRALKIYLIPIPGFRSLRSLHPGLNSSASFAGSLTRSTAEDYKFDLGSNYLS